MSAGTVTRAQLSEAVYQEVGLSRNESAELVESVIAEISDALERGEMVKISSFGSTAIRHFLMPLEIFQATQANAFTSATRVNPIYFHFPYQEIDDLSFHCADGFAAESMPAAKKIDLGAVFYEISAAQRGDGIEVKRQLDVNKVLFGRELDAALRSFFGAVRTNDNAEMVLHNSTSAKNN